MNEKIKLNIAEMTLSDIPDVKAVEKKCFREQWPEDSFKKELQNKKVSCFLITRTDGGRLAGYVGSWMIIDELHITTIGVDPDFRGRKVGKFLVWHLLKKAVDDGCRWATLEVSENNTAARKIYESFGFKKIGKRNNYYNFGEDAIVMWVGKMQYPAFMEKMEEIKSEWEEKICLY